MTAQDNSTRLPMIDDDVELCRLIAAYLTPLGYDVGVAHTGPERAASRASQSILRGLSRCQAAADERL